MKKLWLALILFAVIGVSTFGDTGEPSTGSQEEVDFLLFLPNSGTEFADEDQTMIHLDNVAGYLLGRNLSPGQIHVYGYAAAAINDIDGEQLSRERALLVIQELQRRGLPAILFAEPVAYGEVNLWGNNEDEQARSPNRRVRILLDGVFLTPQHQPPPVADPAEPEEPAPAQDDEGGSRFPWILLLLLIPLFAAILFFALRKKKPGEDKPVPALAAEPVAEKAPPVIPVVISYSYVNLEEEIRLRAYELYQERCGRDENAYEDWCRAVIEVCARYKASGYETYAENENWWARRESRESRESKQNKR